MSRITSAACGDCPPEAALLDFIRGVLIPSQLDTLARHFSGCTVCDERLSQLESQPDALTLGLQRASAPRLTAGGTIGDYEILGLLGRGGMAEVWRARHRRMNREVAIKVISDRAGSTAALRDRFQREVEVLADLQHPNIAVAHDAGEHQGCPYLVMELLEGEDLGERLARGPLPVAEACHAVLQAARGLAYAHERGLVHRDVKPANLFRLTDGTIKVLDLGLVRREVEAPTAGPLDAVNLAGRGTVLTSATTIMGTLDYAAPEQMTAAATVDAKADVYSLGCTLYALLTGKSPFARATAEATLQAHREETPPTPANLPAEVGKLMARMIAKSASDRPTMQEVNAALAPLQSRPRHGQWLAAVAMLLSLAVVLVALLRPRGESAGPSEPPAAVKPMLTKLETVMTPESAAAFQTQYAADLGVRIVENNSLDMPMVLIPPGLIGELKLACPRPLRVCAVPTLVKNFRDLVQLPANRGTDHAAIATGARSWRFRIWPGPSPPISSSTGTDEHARSIPSQTPATARPNGPCP